MLSRSKKKPKNDDTTWVTIGGKKIPIGKGDDKDALIKKAIGDMDKEPKKDTPKDDKKDTKSEPTTKTKKDLDDDTEDEIDKDGGEFLTQVNDAYNFSKSGIGGGELDQLKNHMSLNTNPEASKLSVKLGDINQRDKAVKDMKNHLSDNDYKDFVKQIKYEDEVNKKLQKTFDDAKFVYRGVSKAELDSFNKTGKFGKDDGLFGFVFATVSPIKAQQFGKGQAIVKIDKAKMGNDIKPMFYTAFARNTGDDKPDFSKGIWGQGTEFSHQSVAIKSGSSTKAIDTTYKESFCSKCGESVDLVGSHPTLKAKKKKKEILSFEFNEKLDESWKEIEHYLYEDAVNKNVKKNTVGDPEFRAFTHSSSFVGNVLWDRESREMDVILNGKTYHFCHVSERLYDSFEGASSKGAFFNREIKTLHDCS